MKILGGLYTTGGGHTQPLAFIPPISEQKLISSANEMVEQFEGNNEK